MSFMVMPILQCGVPVCILVYELSQLMGGQRIFGLAGKTFVGKLYLQDTVS